MELICIRWAVNQMGLLNLNYSDKDERRQSLYFRNPHIIYISFKISVPFISQTSLLHRTSQHLPCNKQPCHLVYSGNNHFFLAQKSFSQQFGLCSAWHPSGMIQVDCSQLSSFKGLGWHIWINWTLLLHGFLSSSRSA